MFYDLVRRRGRARLCQRARQSIVDTIAASGQIIHPHRSPHLLFAVTLEHFHVKVLGPAQHLARDGPPRCVHQPEILGQGIVLVEETG